LLVIVLLFLIVAAGTGGELCVSRAMKQVGEATSFHPLAVLAVIWRAMKNGWMWLGITGMTLGFLSLLTILSFQNVSFVVPVTALSYAGGVFGGTAFLGEQVGPRRWLGVLLVCLGVTLVWAGKS
jgi:drug/metabolite transporter (DMT)-like permease